MKKLSQKQLTDHVNLVKWEEHKTLEKFNLLTVHSLLLNGNQKFIELKTKIETFNSMLSKGVQRKHLQYEYTKKLYEMLRYMVNIKNYEMQQDFLQKVYNWSQGGKADWDFQNEDGLTSKSRPTTATTRSRPFSAYSRPKSGYNRIAMMKLQQPATKIKQQKKTNPTIDYQKLKPGDYQFFTGQRTLHEQERMPKKKLKQYQRKVFYDEEPDSDLQVIDLKEQKPPVFQFKNLNLPQQKEADLENLAQGQAANGQINLQGEENQQGQDDIGQQGQDDVNIDDIPLQGQAQGQQKTQEIVDKLKPRLKAFIKHETQLSKNQINYVKGMNHYVQQRNKLIRKTAEDDIMKMKMLEWAKEKSRTKREQKRRAESARIVTKKIGIGYKETNKNQQENINVINLQSIPVPQTKKSRPKTAFRAFNESNRKQLITNCFITGAMQGHIQKFQNSTGLTVQRDQRIVSLAQKPKKKTFEQILREAQQRVLEQQDEQIINVKEKFARSKVPFETNRIAKSVTYHAGGAQQEQYEEQQQLFSGGIIGMNMLNNPFFKVGKKKKKKKKKK